MLSDDNKLKGGFLNTGVGIELAKTLSAIFVKSEHYGTQSSYVLLVDYENNSLLCEQNYLRGTFSEFRFSLW